MENIYSILQELGLTRGEITVYIASLKVGLTSASKIAEVARLPRTTVNSILKSLKEKGIIQYVVKSGVRYFSAVSPRTLVEKLHEREQRLKAIIPSLEELQKLVVKKPLVEFYEGPEGFKTVAEDLIKIPNTVVYGWVASQNMEYLPVYHLQFRRKRKERNIRAKIITDKTHLTLELQKRDKEELRETRFSGLMEKRNVSLFIYGEKVAYFLVTKAMQLGIIIKNEEIAEFQRTIFEKHWKQQTLR